MSDKTTPKYDEAAFDLIVSLRGGGIPTSCDFCNREFTSTNYPIPEEAGEWVCRECLTRWEEKEKTDER